MKVWLKYKEPSDKDYDYELIDLNDAASEMVDSEDYPNWPTETEANFNQTVLHWLDDHGACVYGDHWFGDPGWQWFIVDKPPMRFFLDKMRYARVRSEEYAKEAYNISCDMIGYYPDFMGEIGGYNAERSYTSQTED